MQLLSLSYKERGRAQRRAWHMTQTGQTPIYLLPQCLLPSLHPLIHTSQVANCFLLWIVIKSEDHSFVVPPQTWTPHAKPVEGEDGNLEERQAVGVFEPIDPLRVCPVRASQITHINFKPF